MFSVSVAVVMCGKILLSGFSLTLKNIPSMNRAASLGSPLAPGGKEKYRERGADREGWREGHGWRE